MRPWLLATLLLTPAIQREFNVLFKHLLCAMKS
jgi:hypothetical protein